VSNWVYLAAGSELGREALAEMISLAREIKYETVREHLGAATLKKLGESLGYDRRVGLTMKKDTDGVHYYSASLNHVPVYVIAGTSPTQESFAHVFVQEQNVHRVLGGVTHCATPNPGAYKYERLRQRLEYVGLDGSGRIRFKDAADAINGAGWDAVRDVGFEPLNAYRPSRTGSTFVMGLGARVRDQVRAEPASVAYTWWDLTDADGNSLGVVVGANVILK